MTSPELELFDANPQWRLLLAAYRERHSVKKTEWCPRIATVDGVESGQLSTIHGRLMALGMLKFEIGSRTEGVHYQVTPFGRQALQVPGERQLVPDWQQPEESEIPAA
ncbi:MAG: hypothetical protein EXS05_09785 [Planctomycetaceae bacterium]|nr:hypothetical protein [Planctomycetaceae bacterium]